MGRRSPGRIRAERDALLSIDALPPFNEQTSARRRRCVMLRVTTLYASSAAATAAYYTHYLAQAPGEEAGVWSGREAADLGLAGRVEADDLELLLEGRDPTTGTPLGNVLRDRTLSSGKVCGPWRGSTPRSRRRNR